MKNNIGNLTEEQKAILARIRDDFMDAAMADLGLAMVAGFGVFAFNGQNVSCFDCPSDAAYDGGKTEVDVISLPYTGLWLSSFHICEPKALVGWEE